MNPFADEALAEHLGAQQIDCPTPKSPSQRRSIASKHARIRQEHRHLHLPADLRPTAKRAASVTGRAPLDPELGRIVSLCRRGLNPRTKRVSPLPATCPVKCATRCDHAQPPAWRKARDAYAAANYDLAHRAAQKQWERNRHLERETVPCVYCIGKKCARCRGRGQYKCQPDLERLAYIGLLEAIRMFDPSKAHCISSYAVHTMKQSMLTLLRQTPVFYPQDLLRDRREIAALRKRLNEHVRKDEPAIEPTELEAAEALVAMDRAALEKAKGRPLRADEIAALRAKAEAKGLGERARLALNCYYGNERKSVEELQERYVQRAERGAEKRHRRSKVAGMLEVLCVDHAHGGSAQPESEDLTEAVRELPSEHRLEVERYMRGRGEVSAVAMSALREVML